MSEPLKAVKEKIKGGKPSLFERRLAPELEPIREQLAEIEASGLPVVAGPFTSEVGFELLYWIPMLRWAVHEFPGLRGRLVVVSRGGVEPWLDGLDAQYVDVLSLASVDELMQRRVSLKQREVLPFELEILDRARDRLGLAETALLHPMLLFNLYYKVSKFDQSAFARSVKQTDDGIEGLVARFDRLRPPPLGRLEGALPDEFVAVRFYGRPSLPADDANIAFTDAVVRGLARERPVVLLNNGLELDDHSDFRFQEQDGVIDLSREMRPDDNLAVQSAIVSRASAFVGTYGGLAYLAPFYGVPSVAFSSHPEHAYPWHSWLAHAVFAHKGWGSLLVFRSTELERVNLILRGMR
jgi:hypothetical protein